MSARRRGDGVHRAVKRVFDLVVAIPGLVIVSPLFLVATVWIKLDSPGPVFFRQIRVGRLGRRFRIYKFRTMVVDAERSGRQITPENDHRITRSGRLLRKSKLDELPQLINVIRGEMSLVGPRPEVPRYVEQYTPEQQAVIALTPGITDPASIRYRDEGELLAASDSPEDLYITHLMPEKIRINLEYADRATVLTDIGVLLRTLVSLVRR